MSRNNEKNIRKHNDKLHKAQAKAKLGAKTRRDKLSEIITKFNSSNSVEPTKPTENGG